MPLANAELLQQPDPAAIEALAAAAWPAALTRPLDGWSLRFNDGVTRRANSVLALTGGQTIPLDDKLDRVEQFYRSRGVPPCFHVGPITFPDDLDAILARRGYAAIYRTHTQWTKLAGMLARTQVDGKHRVEMNEDFDQRWFKTYCQAEQTPAENQAARSGILQRLTLTKVCALTCIGRSAVATGFGVLQGDWLGIFSVATRPEFRRRRAATAALHALAEWGLQRGARCAYLQVLESNAPARALYDRAGFETAFTYYYRELDLAAAPAGEGPGDLEN